MPRAGFLFADDASSHLDPADRVVRVPRGVASEARLLALLADALAFPEGPAGSMDALEARLRDLSWLREPRVVLLHEELPALPPRGLAGYIDALRGAALEEIAPRRAVLARFPTAAEDRVRQLLRAC